METRTKDPRGRKRSIPEDAVRPVQTHVTSDELRVLKRAAALSDQTLKQFAREVLLEAAGVAAT